MQNDALGLYVHIPFCVQKCSYCDFLSAPATAATKQAYVQALTKEIRSVGAAKGKPATDTLYLGGGTPSVLSLSLLEDIMDAVGAAFALLPDAEITMEVNPGTLSAELVAFLRRRCNRVNLGVQSVHDAELHLLGRIHTAAEAASAVRDLQMAGLSNISVDLMSGLPGQRASTLQESIETVASWGVQHISLYGLQLEEGTALAASVAAGKLQLPKEEDERAMAVQAVSVLEKLGYARYEISNFAKPGFAAAHNCRYWQCRPYLGCGIGAASYDEDTRFSNTRDLDRYLAAEGDPAIVREDVRHVDETAAMEEYCFLGLRMTEGISATAFAQRFGRPLAAVFGAVIEKYKALSLLRFDGERLALTAQGMDVSNVVLADFLITETDG